MSGALLTGLPDADAIHHAAAGEQAAVDLCRRIAGGVARADELGELMAQAAADAMAGSRPIASDPRFKAMARRIQARIAAAEREGQRR